MRTRRHEASLWRVPFFLTSLVRVEHDPCALVHDQLQSILLHRAHLADVLEAVRLQDL